MKFSKFVVAIGLSLGVLFSANAASAVPSVPEFEVPLPGPGFFWSADIGGYEEDDPIAIFNVLVPDGGGTLASLTIYTRDPALDFFDTDYNYDLTINGVLQSWDPASGAGYRYLFDVPLMSGTNVFAVTLEALSPGQLFAPAGTTAQFFFLPPGAPVPVPLPATGVLLIGVLLGGAGLRAHAKRDARLN